MSNRLKIKEYNPLGSNVFTVWIIDITGSRSGMRIGKGSSAEEAREDARNTLRRFDEELGEE